MFQKQTFHLTSTIHLQLRCSTEKQTQLHKYYNNSPYFSYCFFKFPFFRSRVFIFFVFCVSSNKLNSISCGICLSFKSRHLELFWKIFIQLFSTGILLGLWSRGPPCNFTEQLLFLHNCEWLLQII